MPKDFSLGCWKDSTAQTNDTVTITLDYNESDMPGSPGGSQSIWTITRTLDRVFVGKNKSCSFATGFQPCDSISPDLDSRGGNFPVGLPNVIFPDGRPPETGTFYAISPVCCTSSAVVYGAYSGDTVTRTDWDGAGHPHVSDVVIPDGTFFSKVYKCRQNVFNFDTPNFNPPEDHIATVSISEVVAGNGTTNAEQKIIFGTGRFFAGFAVFTVNGVEFTISGGKVLIDIKELFIVTPLALPAESYQITEEVNGFRIGFIGPEGKKVQPLIVLSGTNSGDDPSTGLYPSDPGADPMLSGDITPARSDTIQFSTGFAVDLMDFDPMTNVAGTKTDIPGNLTITLS